MKVDDKNLKKAMRNFQPAVSKNLEQAIRKSVHEGVRLAKVMAPKDTGDLASGIHAKFEYEDGVFRGSIEAAEQNAQAQRKAVAVEFGRQNESKPSRGTTVAVPFLQRTRGIISQKHAGRITRAIGKARREVGL